MTFLWFLLFNTLLSWECIPDGDSSSSATTGTHNGKTLPRYAVDVPVQLVTQEPTKVVIVPGRGSALNCGGMAVSGRVEMAVGTQVAVEFAPPCSTQGVTVRCFVRNRQHHTYGLEFIAENDSDYESVRQIETILGSLGTAGSVES